LPTHRDDCCDCSRPAAPPRRGRHARCSQSRGCAQRKAQKPIARPSAQAARNKWSIQKVLHRRYRVVKIASQIVVDVAAIAMGPIDFRLLIKVNCERRLLGGPPNFGYSVWTSTCSPERRLLRDSDTSGIGSKVEVPGGCSKRRW
jgi:hypothetical protein